jgi:hypothetical protein
LLFEDEHAEVLPGPIEVATLGFETKTALSRSEIRAPVSFAKAKPKDWPAFQASRMRTIRQSEQDFIHMQVSGANEANLIYVIKGFPYKDAELKVLASISSARLPEKLGRLMLMVYRACRDRRL